MNIENIEKSVKRSRIIITSILIFTIAAYIIWFFAIQNQNLSTDSSTWGAFGDFIGGLLNPLIAYSAFYWLTVSVLVQKQELAETKQALIDSSNAQQDQVEVANKNTEIEIINMRLNKINIQLEAELNYRNIIIDNSMGNGRNLDSLDNDGGRTQPHIQLAACNIRINTLQNEQQELIDQADQIINVT